MVCSYEISDHLNIHLYSIYNVLAVFVDFVQAGYNVFEPGFVLVEIELTGALSSPIDVLVEVVFTTASPGI